MTLITATPRPRHDRAWRIGLFGAWLLVVAWLVSRHIFWRDEVRALSLALQGDSVVAMVRGLQGEGHPALWYLLLRGAHAVVPVREVLPATALLIAVAAMAVFTFRSPFRPAIVALVLFGGFGLFEYAVSARNYGISMLILFLLADRYPQARDRGVTLGILLFALANTNAHAAILAAAFLLFWFVELILDHGLRWRAPLKVFIVNAGIAAIGAACCFVEIYPPYNDAAAASHPGSLTVAGIASALVSIAPPMASLAPEIFWGVPGMAIVLAVVLLFSPFGLLRAPAAFIATIVTLPAFVIFFQLVYPGSYRHQALYVVFLIAMYWLAETGRGGRWPRSTRVVSAGTERRLIRIGRALFAVLLAFQVPSGVQLAAQNLHGRVFSRARDLGELLHRPGLGDAIVIANPDHLLEPLPYYAPNPIYLVREHRFGRVVRFSRANQLALSLSDMLATAKRLATTSGRPVVIVLQVPIDPVKPAQMVDQGYVGSFTMTPEQVRAFLRATHRIAHFGPAVTDESYDVYLLDRAARAR